MPTTPWLLIVVAVFSYAVISAEQCHAAASGTGGRASGLGNSVGESVGSGSGVSSGGGGDGVSGDGGAAAAAAGSGTLPVPKVPFCRAGADVANMWMPVWDRDNQAVATAKRVVVFGGRG